MWRKFNKQKDPAIGSPTLIETTFDQQYLDTIPEVDSLRSGPSNGTSPGLPELPFKPVEPLARQHHPAADHRASSVYSQPGTETLRVVPNGSDRMPSVYSEVSPLTSPRASADFDPAESPDVSPIEPRPPAAQDFPKRDPKIQSHLPILRKATPTGDPARPESGPSSSWKRSSLEGVGSREATPPLEFSKEARLAMSRERNKKLLSGFQDRVSPVSKDTTKHQRDDSLDHPVYREPWKGASGRTTLVDPVHNVPRSKIETGPIPKRKSAIKERSIGKDSSAHTAVTEPAARSTSVEPLSPAGPTRPEEAADEPIKPTAPLKIGNRERVRSPMTAQNLSGPFNPRYSDATTISSYEQAPSDIVEGNRDGAQVTSPSADHAKAFSDSPDHLRPSTVDDEQFSRFSWTTHGTTTTPPPKTPEHDPSSRFSWTTYAPSVHDGHRPSASIGSNTPAVPPVPPVPAVPYMPNAMAMRQRPNPSHSADATPASKPKINRKPAPSDASPNPSSSSLHGTSTSTITAAAHKSPTAAETPPADKSKSLPQCPPELEAKDRIASLEARMEVLNRRRRNINQILKELNNVVQPTSFAYDLATKEEVKKTVKALEDELSEIRVEEHQIGMTLHRALKKRDQESVYGYPTGLWIKRVTA